MKLTLSTLACPDWTLQQIVSTAAEAGIGGIDFRGIGAELDITQLPAFGEQLPETLALLRQHKLVMPCLNTSVTLVTPTLTRWEPMLAEARRNAALAGKTGTRFLRIFGGAIPAGMSPEDALGLARDHLRAIVNLCKASGCKPLLETHDAWVLHTEIEKLLNGFAPEEAGVLWDVEHPWRGGEAPAITVKTLGKRIEHVHIKDTRRRAGKSIPLLLGEGELPLGECRSALTEIGYTGWICLETEKRWHAEGPDPEVSIPQFARYMRQAWAPA
jgi:sugar phosphate isomerase/epimerase